MKRFLSLLAILWSFSVSAQDILEPVTFRLDLNDVIEEIPNSDSAQVFIQTSVANWVDIPMEDIGGNGIWRKNIFISHPEDENIDVFYRFKITSFGDNGLPFTMWEGGYVDTTCLIDPSTQGLAQGDIRQILFPQELIDNGTYVNPTGEYKLTHCFNECGNEPCEPEVITYDSWINVQFDFDGYADEVSWNIYNSNGDVIASGGGYENGQAEAFQQIFLDSGDYTFELLDAWGDGLGYPPDNLGWCLVFNDCQEELFYAEGNYGDGVTQTFNVEPCALPDPPVVGCMDENALNYDETADVNDEFLCEYPVCDGLGEWFVEQTCDGGSALLYYNWEANTDNPNCNVVQINYGGSGTNSYTFDVNIDNGIWGVYAGNGQMPPNWEEEFSFQATFADGTVSDTILYTPYPCTQGCTNEDAPNYNPWATEDDGSC